MLAKVGTKQRCMLRTSLISWFLTEADIWSLGIILYTLLCGGLPFDDDDEHVMKSLIMKGEYEEPEWLSDGPYLGHLRPLQEADGELAFP